MRLKIPPALRQRPFRLFWFGFMISVTGSQMQFWALLWHIRELTDQPIALGGVGAARIVPLAVFSLYGGVIADRQDRQRVMYLTQSSMALLAVLLGTLTLDGSIRLWHFYLLTGLQAIAQAFDLPARQALVPNLVAKEDFSNAMSMTSIALQTGSILGPALSGVTIALFGLQAVYFINALTFIAVIAALILMGKVHQDFDEGNRVSSLDSIRAGIHFLRTKPIIFSSMLLDFFATFFSSANALMPIFARDILGVGEVGYGWLSAAQSIGATLAALAISQLGELRRQGPVLLWAVVVFGLATALFGFSDVFLFSMLTLMLIGAADTVSAIIRNTIRQIRTPDNMRGRMVGINQLFFIGGPQLGEIEASTLAQLFGAPFAVVSGGFACVLAVAWIARRWPQLAAYDSE
jgi:MFS family permease